MHKIQNTEEYLTIGFQLYSNILLGKSAAFKLAVSVAPCSNLKYIYFWHYQHRKYLSMIWDAPPGAGERSTSSTKNEQLLLLSSFQISMEDFTLSLDQLSRHVISYVTINLLCKPYSYTIRGNSHVQGQYLLILWKNIFSAKAKTHRWKNKRLLPWWRKK